MDPRDFGVDEAFDELCSGDGTCGARANIFEVCGRGFQLVVVRVVHGEGPDEFTCGLACFSQAFNESCCVCFGVGEEAGIVVSQSDDACSCQGGQVDDEVRFVSFQSVSDGIGEDESSFGIGVIDFYGETVVHGDDITGIDSGMAGFIVGGGDESDDVMSGR